MKRFDFVVFGDEVKHFKPAPDLYQKAIEKSGYMPQECLVFEDSVSGVMAAHDAGLMAVSYTHLIIGTYVGHVPFLGKVFLFLQSMWGLLTLLAVLAILIINRIISMRLDKAEDNGDKVVFKEKKHRHKDEDVYKRQLLGTASADTHTLTYTIVPQDSGYQLKASYIANGDYKDSQTTTSAVVSNNTPVSYTHLDVYKRQPIHRPMMMPAIISALPLRSLTVWTSKARSLRFPIP